MPGRRSGDFHGGGYPLPTGLNESELLGAWYREPVQVVKCETSDLLVPASTEIVIEGMVSLQTELQEGPMGEYGAMSGRDVINRFPVSYVTAHDLPGIIPICPLCVAGVPVEENHTNWGNEYCRKYSVFAPKNGSSGERMLYSHGKCGSLACSYGGSESE